MRLFLLVLFCQFSLVWSSVPQRILVSVEPQKFFVERIGGELVEVQVLVPPGASPHSFEPTAKQLLQASDAKIWFRIGEPFETKAMNILKNITIIDMRRGMELRYGGCCKEACDTHIWLSPKRAQILSGTIKEALIEHFPDSKIEIEERYEVLMKELGQLDLELSALLKPSMTIVVSHPAFGYLADDYHFTQLSIEVEGKEPSARELTDLLRRLRGLRPKTLFAEEQYHFKATQLIANELGASLCKVDPYSSDYLSNMREIAHLFAEKS